MVRSQYLLAQFDKHLNSRLFGTYEWKIDVTFPSLSFRIGVNHAIVYYIYIYISLFFTLLLSLLHTIFLFFSVSLHSLSLSLSLSVSLSLCLTPFSLSLSLNFSLFDSLSDQFIRPPLPSSYCLSFFLPWHPQTLSCLPSSFPYSYALVSF